nr:beta-1,6-N-acetylglucosaminyltransferase [uncultured Chitinophaga sp.]
MILNFLILVHQQPSQLERLVRLLDFPQARFFIHVDKKTDLKRFRPAVSHISSPVTFIRRRHNISWGGMEMVAATLDLIEAAVAPGEKGYFILLSGQDLPLKPVTAFYDYLEAHYGEEYLSFRRLPYSNWNMNGGLDRIEYYWFMDQLPPEENMRLYEAQKNAGMRRIFPFDINLFGGSQWWCLTNEAATYICDFLNVNPEYTDYFRHTFIPDESFFQTILLNGPFSGRVTGNNLRFMDWSGPEMPKVLTMDDYDRIMGSGCFFARKFDEERDITVVRKVERGIGVW